MSLKYCIIFVFLVFFKTSSQAPTTSYASKECFTQNSRINTKVFLTISSLYVSNTTKDGVVKRRLEINWEGGVPDPEDVISIYNADPAIHLHQIPILSIPPHKYPGGFFRSEIIIPVILLNSSHLAEDHCLGYWVTYKNATSGIISSSCLRIQPFWMEDNSIYLSHQALNDVMIPGSHDSGSFDYHKEDGPLSKYKYAQEENIFSQLVYGLRYFDLRVGYYKKSKDKFYINHNFLKTSHSVKSVLHQVIEFVKVAKKEIIILDFHAFPVGFNNNHTHENLMSMIVRTLGHFLIPNTKEYQNATFSLLWKYNKRILVSYDSATREKSFYKLLWPSIPRAWGNKQYPEQLKVYFKNVFEKPLPQGLWASMAELTPNAKTILLHPETGLRVFAEMINRNVTYWFRDLYWQKANIIATDFFLGNNIIDVAIRTNKIKGLCPENYWPQLKP